MSNEEDSANRVRFLGLHDLATGWQVERVAEIVGQFDASRFPSGVMDIIELHNVAQYLQHGLLPRTYSEAEREMAMSRLGPIQGAVARYFSGIDDGNCAALVGQVDFEYHADLLELLGRNKAFERCTASVMLPALDQAGVHLGDMLACKRLVAAYDAEIRDQILSSPKHAEHVVRKYMQKDLPTEAHLPASFEPTDVRDLLERYVDSPGANPNYISLIETARIDPATGVDAKLKLRAKRRNSEWTQEFFEQNAGMRTGAEVAISETQAEASKLELDESDGLVARFTYSSRWLGETCDNPSILNNFQHLFEFADGHGLLTLPAYPAQLGVLERVMGVAGIHHYQVGVRFRVADMSSHLQTRLYQQYLEAKERDLEEVLSWFFERYLTDEFGALRFSFQPSSRGASYLERVRHLFAEMESVLTQFSLFVESGELDRDLLTIASHSVRYKQVPSLLPGKYVYPTESLEMVGILHALFSDQSTLAYLNEELNAESAARLLIENQVAYDDFHEYQKPVVDQLIAFGILENTPEHVSIANGEQFLVLRALFTTQACSYFHLSAAGRREADAMVARGWAERRASLLTEAEGEYFNYFLNKHDHSNGPELRNKYLHGSQADGDGEDTHVRTYITALRLMVALVIKLNDDFCLWAREQPSSAEAG